MSWVQTVSKELKVHWLQPTLEEEKSALVVRERLYSFLSRAFLREADSEFLGAVVEIEPAITLLASSHSSPVLQKGSALLADFVRRIGTLNDAERERLLTDLAVEYARLFLAAGLSQKEGRAYPWESIYLTNPPQKYGEPYHEVVDAYRMVGYQKPDSSKEPEDHIAFELDLMAHLCRLARNSIESGNRSYGLGYIRLQREFLQDHLMRWLGKFCDYVGGYAETEFYSALASVTKGFVIADAEALDFWSQENDPTAKEASANR